MSSRNHQPPEAALPPTLTGHGETILLAEDQELMQLVTTRLLTRLGYRVLVACSVESALSMWQDHQDKVELLITDYTFHSSLTGMDLIAKLHKRAPALPALIVSGSWLPDPKKKPPLPPNVAFLAKPYAMQELGTTVRRLLDERPHKSKAKPSLKAG